MVSVNFPRPPDGFSDIVFAQDDGQEAVLAAIVGENISKRWCDDSAETKVAKRPHRMLAGRATAKISSRDKNTRIFVPRLMQNEVILFRTLRRISPVVKKKLAKAGTLDPLKELFGDDLVGVHVGALEWRDQSPMYAKWLHRAALIMVGISPY